MAKKKANIAKPAGQPDQIQAQSMEKEKHSSKHEKCKDCPNPKCKCR